MDIDATMSEDTRTINESQTDITLPPTPKNHGNLQFSTSVKTKVTPSKQMSSLAVSSQETANFKTCFHSIKARANTYSTLYLSF